jgi:hypothetical protein
MRPRMRITNLRPKSDTSSRQEIPKFQQISERNSAWLQRMYYIERHKRIKKMTFLRDCECYKTLVRSEVFDTFSTLENDITFSCDFFPAS